MAAVNSIDSFTDADRDPFSWLCQVAEHKLVDAHRHYFEARKRDASKERSLDQRQTNAAVGLGQMLAASFTTPSQAFSRNAREARLSEAVARLPAEQQDALRWRYAENLSSKEIAERLGKSDAATRVLLSRALKRLEAELGQQ